MAPSGTVAAYSFPLRFSWLVAVSHLRTFACALAAVAARPPEVCSRRGPRRRSRRRRPRATEPAGGSARGRTAAAGGLLDALNWMNTEQERSFFFNDTATTEIYTLSLHDALPI